MTNIFLRICCTSIAISSKRLTKCGPAGSDPEKDSHGLTMNHLLLETIRRERETLNLLRANGRIGVAASQSGERARSKRGSTGLVTTRA
jgi:hypothetical protein